MAAKPKVLKETHKIISQTSQPVFCGYSNKLEILPKSRIVCLYKCPSCSTKAVVNNHAVPSCLCCSSTMNLVKKGDKGLKLVRSDLNHMPVVGECNYCGTEYRATAEMANAIAEKKFHCPSCGSTIVAADWNNSADDETTTDEPQDEDNKDASGEECGDGDDDYIGDGGGDGDEDDGGEDDDDDKGQHGEGEGENEEEDQEYSPVDGENGDDEDDDNESGESEESEVNDPRSDALVPPNVDDEDSEDYEDSDRGEAGGNTPVQANVKKKRRLAKRKAVMANKKVIKASPFNWLRKAENVDYNLILSGEGDTAKWYLFANDVPVAIAQYSRASNGVKKLFNKPDAFRVAISDAMSDGISDESMTDFGFEPVKTEIPIDEASQQHIDEQVVSQTSKFKEKLSNTAALYERCLGVAAVGINKGLFNKSGGDPLKDALVAELSRNRVRNPQKIIEEAFTKHGEEHWRAIVEKASELAKKPAEALNETAELVAEATYRTDDEDDTETNTRSSSRVPLSITSDLNDDNLTSGGRTDPKVVDLIADIRRSRVR